MLREQRPHFGGEQLSEFDLIETFATLRDPKAQHEARPNRVARYVAQLAASLCPLPNEF